MPSDAADTVPETVFSCQCIAELLRSLFGADAAYVRAARGAGEPLETLAFAGSGEDPLADCSAPLTECLPYPAPPPGEAVYLPNLRAAFGERVRRAAAAGWHALLAAPFRAGDEMQGTLEVFDPDVDGTTPRPADASLLALLAEHTATFLGHATRFRRLEQEGVWLRRVLESLPLATLVIEGGRSDKAVIALANQATGIMGGSPVAPGILLSQAPYVQRLYRPDRRTRVSFAELASARAIDRGDPVPEEELHLHRPDGEWRVLLTHAVPVRIGGEVQGAVVISRDITEHHKDQVAARVLAEVGSILTSPFDGQAMLQRVVRVVTPELSDACAIFLPDGQGKIDCVAAAHTDPAKRALISQLCTRHRVVENTSCSIATALHTGKTTHFGVVNDDTLRAMAPDAQCLELLRRVGLHASLAIPLCARGQVLGVLWLAVGNSERSFDTKDLVLAGEIARRVALAVDNARLYQEARAMNEAKDQFLAVLSHELRNPISTILTGIESLRRRIPNDESLHRSLDVVERSARLQTRLVDDLLDLSRVNQGKIRLNLEPLELGGVVRTTCLAFQDQAAKSDLSLSINADEPLWVSADFDRLQQVVGNILSNAIKFTPPGGEIGVEVLPDGAEYVRIVIQDNGIGIDETLREHLFEMFRQGAAGARRSGLGIGLALVKSIVEKHHGRVWAESDGPGRGSRFTVVLPRIEPQPGEENAADTTDAAV